ncbi:alpha/beta hydrolase [Gordonia sp. NPDC003424]
MTAAGIASMQETGIEVTRRNLEAIVRPPGPEMRSVVDATAEVRGRVSVPVRVYRPLRAPQTDAPALVWYHGGGMVMGSLHSFDRVARDIAEATGAVLVNVDYRLAPEHRYPAGNDDAYTALLWLHANAGGFGVATSRIGVGGDSAGGGLAAATALRARNDRGPALAQQVMFYPGVERRTDRPSMREFGNSPFLRAEDIDWMKNLYLGDDPDSDDEYGIPSLASDLRGLPLAVIAVGHGDPIRDGVEDYGHRLREAGVQTALLRYPGVGHGFVMQTATVARARAAVAEVGALVAARFAHPV